MRLDALVHQVKNVALMPDGETQLIETAEELLVEYVEQGEITDEARTMLVTLLRGNSHVDGSRPCDCTASSTRRTFGFA